jgi:hypothetical protein
MMKPVWIGLQDWAAYASHLKMKGTMAFVGAVLTPVPISFFGPPVRAT